MSKITLSKALRLKNELVSSYHQLYNKIVRSNVKHPIQPGTTQPKQVECKSIMAEYEKVGNQIIELKIAIAKANGSIVEHLVKVEELKSQISKLTCISTDIPSQNFVNQKLVATDPNTFTLVYGSVDISEEEIAEKVKLLKVELEKSFDAITAHNANTQIELSFDI